jgi:hypothetical protein
VNGAIHPGETLPSGATETGAWWVAAYTGGELPKAAISFPIPLKEPLVWSENKVVNGVKEPENQVHYINAKGNEVPTGGEEIANPPACPGSAEKPEATPGNLCIYAHHAPTEDESGANEGIENPAGGTTSGLGAATSGALLGGTSGGTSSGTWAVTAP